MRTPALYALIFLAAGVLVAVNTTLPAMVYLGIAVLSTAPAIIYHLMQKTTVSRVLICIAIIATGAFLTELQSSGFPSNHVSRFAGADQVMTVTGSIVSEPDIRPTKTFLTVQVDSLQYRSRAIAACGKLRLQIQSPTAAFGYRDRIRFTGYVNLPQTGRNPGAFDYRRYLAIRQISATVTLGSADKVVLLQSGAGEPFVRAIVAPVREYIASVFERFLAPEPAAVMKGFLIGDVRNISSDVYQRFKDTGTLHVLAASGANVAYVITTLLLGLRLFRLPRQYRVYLLIAGVVIFSFLAYNQPSVLRASVMAIVTLVGMALYRDTNWLNNISVAGLVILVFRPLYLYDLGFQLSFGAAFALILFMPPLERFMPKPRGFPRKTVRYFLMIFYGSVIAQLGVTPILIYNFHTIPLVSFLANLVIVPLVGVATTLGIVLVFLSALPVVSTVAATALAVILNLTLSAIDFFHNLPIPQLRLAAPHLLLIIAYYLAVQLILMVVSKRRIAVLFAVMLLVTLNTVIWRDVFAGIRAPTEITFLDTRDQSTVFIEQNNGKTILISAGSSGRSVDLGETVVLPFLLTKGVDHLDEIYATVPQAGKMRSLQAIVSGLAQRHLSDKNDSAYLESVDERIVPLDSIKVFSIGDIAVALLPGETPVQNLNNLPPSINIVAADWYYLQQEGFADLLKTRGVATVILTSYPSFYTSSEPLKRLRAMLPGVNVYSVFESGGIVVGFHPDRYQVLATANN